EAACMPALLARATVSALRPLSEVSTFRPLSTSRFPTAAPIMPGAMTATTGVMTEILCLISDPGRILLVSRVAGKRFQRPAAALLAGGFCLARTRLSALLQQRPGVAHPDWRAGGD